MNHARYVVSLDFFDSLSGILVEHLTKNHWSLLSYGRFALFSTMKINIFFGLASIHSKKKERTEKEAVRLENSG